MCREIHDEKITTVATLVAIVAFASSIIAVDQLTDDIPTTNHVDVMAGNGNDGNSLADTRTSVLAAGKIPNSYLIDRTGDLYYHYT